MYNKFIQTGIYFCRLIEFEYSPTNKCTTLTDEKDSVPRVVLKVSETAGG